MTTRRNFLVKSGALAVGTMILPSWITYNSSVKLGNIGVQLYTFRDEMTKDAIGTLKKIADLGFKQIESARSEKGHYYGLTPFSIKKVCDDLGMNLRSGHVHIDKNWKKTVEEAAASGQEYLICSTMPSRGQTVDNYKSVAEVFNKAGEDCKKHNIKFGYHNHAYEFEMHKNQVLYDVLMDYTNPDLVHMELDLGWVIVGGKDPIDYFKKYPGRFPLWHLKDMDMIKKESTEFGKGGLDISKMLQYSKESGLKYVFIEQEEYEVSPLESMKHNLKYLQELG
ncbi:sugar phosphate isomerase/epimerase family protein [Urechidicola croceus]|uniref:Xylose isomerase-like TIM barrel domain-containing protein n=1 Tax=Urechidicola croceus TaxID=1850246 RepID=A0A1D8P5F9_9FLAO|nr:sugar phosphate isomerase/epimerase [Urechidicola croceus]AOW19807.1 hypothetical protein LPB138_03520 [Urechidicola croceus]